MGFAPAYDLLSMKIIQPKERENLALKLDNKKLNFSKGYFDQFGELLKFNEKQINSVNKRLKN